jgi:hypothetical protein
VPLRALDAPSPVVGICRSQEPSEQRQLDWVSTHLFKAVSISFVLELDLCCMLHVFVLLKLMIHSSNAVTPNAPTFDRPNRLKGREEGIIRWGELLEKFRAVQERARRLQRMGGGSGDPDDATGNDWRLGDASNERGQGLDGTGGAPGRPLRGPVPVLRETPPPPPAKAEQPTPKLRTGLGRQFGRLGGAVAGRGKRA